MNPADSDFGGKSLRRVIYAIKYVLWGALYWPWVVYGYVCRPVHVDNGRKLTILIRAYSLARMRNLGPLVRSLLKCSFVAKIIVTNNNPELRVCDQVRVRDNRLVLLDQSVRHGPGYCWALAACEEAEYFMCVDDDVLLFPGQAAILFRRLVERPAVPHGLAGRTRSGYVQCREAEVDGLFLLYAVTRAQVAKYLEYVERITATGLMSEADVELWAEDMVVSRTGSGKPLIHDVGFLLQGLTCWTPGVAIHQSPEFWDKRRAVAKAMDVLLSEQPVNAAGGHAAVADPT